MQSKDGIPDATYVALGLQPGGTLHIRQFALLEWGQSLHFACIYRLPEHADQQLEMRFLDCRDMKWRTYAFAGPQDEVLIVDARLGRGEHRSPVHLLTDRFGVSLFYGALQVEHST